MDSHSAPPAVQSVRGSVEPASSDAAAFQSALAQYGSAVVPPRPGRRRPPSRPDDPLVCTLCHADLVRTAYAQRTRLCLPCMTAPSVENGTTRFCQRCHRLHPLDAYEGAKRSCEAKLSHAGSARRERRRVPAKKPAGPKALPAAVTTPPNTHSSPASPELSSEFAASEAAFADILGDIAPAPLCPPSFLTGWEVEAEALPWMDDMLGDGAGLSLHSAHLKLPHASSPAALPHPTHLSSALRDAFGADAPLVGCGLRAGCLLLSLDFLLYSAEGETQVAEASFAPRLAAALRPLLPPRSAALRSALLRISDISIPLLQSAQTQSDSDSARPPPPRPLRPAHHIPPASASAAPPLLSLQLAEPLPASCLVQARALGRALSVAPVDLSQPLLLQISMEGLSLSDDARGALLLLECEPAAEPHGEPLCRVSPAAPLLVSSNPTLVAEINAAASAAPAFQRALCAIALGMQPGAPLGLRLGGAAAALRLGLAETLWELTRPRGGVESAARAAMGEEGLEGEEELTIALWLDAVRGSALCAETLARTGWRPLLAGAGWGGKRWNEDGFGAAKAHAASLFRAARSDSADVSPAMAAAAAEAAAAGSEEGRAAVPFLRALTHLLCAESLDCGEGEAAAASAAVSDSPFFDMGVAVLFGGTPYLVPLWTDLIEHALSGNPLSARPKLTPEALHAAVRQGPLPMRYIADLYVHDTARTVAGLLVVSCLFVAIVAPQPVVKRMAAFTEFVTAVLSLLLTVPHIAMHLSTWQRWRLAEAGAPLIFTHWSAPYQCVVSGMLVARAARLTPNLGTAILLQRAAMLAATLIWPQLHVLPTSSLAHIVVPLQVVALLACAVRRRSATRRAVQGGGKSGPAAEAETYGIFTVCLVAALGLLILRTMVLVPWLAAEDLRLAAASGAELGLAAYLKDSWPVLLAVGYVPLDKYVLQPLASSRADGPQIRETVWVAHSVGVQLVAFAWSLRFSALAGAAALQLPRFHWTAAAFRFLVSVQSAAIACSPAHPPEFAYLALLLHGAVILAASAVPGCLYLPPFSSPAWAPWGGLGFQTVAVGLHAGMFFVLAALQARRQFRRGRAAGWQLVSLRLGWASFANGCRPLTDKVEQSSIFLMMRAVLFAGTPYLLPLWANLLGSALAATPLSARPKLSPEALHAAVRQGPLPIRYIADLYVQESARPLAVGLVIVCLLVAALAPLPRVKAVAALVEHVTGAVSLLITAPHVAMHVSKWQRWRLDEAGAPLTFSHWCVLYQCVVSGLLVARAARLTPNLGTAILLQRAAMLAATLIWPQLHVLPTSSLAPLAVPLQMAWLLVYARRRFNAKARRQKED